MAEWLTRRLGVLGAILALTVTGCTAHEPTGESEPGESEGEGAAGTAPDEDESVGPFPTDPEQGLEAFYDQEIDWEDCEDGRHCGSVTVPLDYAVPEGPTIEIVFVATSLEDRPFLLINPGGPGSSGYDIVADQPDSFFTAELQEEFNILGFDPRGVGRSEPVECMSDDDYDAWNQLTGQQEWDADLELEATTHQQIVEQCQELSGEIIEHSHTVATARDMDILRSALAEDHMHYLGMSYGTKLGLSYAEMFPERIGRFVLDGVMDVSLSLRGISDDQAVAFERQLWEFAHWCADLDCPLEGDAAEVVSGVAELIDQAEENPYREVGGDERLITASTIVSGMITPMYVPGGRQALMMALEVWVEQDDPGYFQYFADLQAGRNADGSYDWIATWPFRTVMCMDYPDTGEGQDAPGLLDIEEAPHFREWLDRPTDFCSALPADPVGEPWEPSEELPEMLLIGGTQDPATPVEWAENVHSMLPNSALLVYDGEGHISYRPGQQCVTAVVEEYLIEGQLFEGREDC